MNYVSRFELGETNSNKESDKTLRPRSAVSVECVCVARTFVIKSVEKSLEPSLHVTHVLCCRINVSMAWDAKAPTLFDF